MTGFLPGVLEFCFLPDLSDLDVECRVSPARRMPELQVVCEDGELRQPHDLDTLTLKDSRVKVVVSVPNGPENLLRFEQRDNLWEKSGAIV